MTRSRLIPGRRPSLCVIGIGRETVFCNCAGRRPFYFRESTAVHRRGTIAILLSVAAFLVLWDVAVALSPEPDDTISEVVLDWAGRHPIVPFALGVLCGHLFWPQFLED